MRLVVILAMAAALSACAPDGLTDVRVGQNLVLRVEVARTANEQRVGLTERSDVGDGMLFLFEGQRHQEVWMAGMQVPLDVAWIVDGAVVEVRTLDPCTLEDQDMCERWTSPVPVDALLEVPAGTLRGVPVGTAVEVGE